ncbi:hypothetical protein DFP80_103327 [Marinomonas rhizomae]|uniref:Uncharacterized protein n=1 Tax=Marinomonas rhizomae TaxID=491948 RepID=A0A366JCY2_9GAMM|nr:hypothetical protein DFP80_103327 [Marinomonas rhizomae]
MCESTLEFDAFILNSHPQSLYLSHSLSSNKL